MRSRETETGLFIDLYELTMAQGYFRRHMEGQAYFEVAVRHLPPHWGFFVMAGLSEVLQYIEEFSLTGEDIDYLRTTQLFSADFLSFIGAFKPRVTLRGLTEGTVFFPGEPILEVGGTLIDAQILESYVLNILGYSVIEASLATRYAIAAGGAQLIEFGLRRAHGPFAALRAARGAAIAGFAGTSNVAAAHLLGLAPAGTMAHSYVQAHRSEEEAFFSFARDYGDAAILLVDTFDCAEGIRTAARVAAELQRDAGIHIKGIRIDSGNLVELSRLAKSVFQECGVAFMKIFVSGGLDEFSIHDLVARGAQIDGYGVGSRLSASHFAPDIDIAYKLVQYDGKQVRKCSPEKATLPGRKSLQRVGDTWFEKDVISPLALPGDLLQPITHSETISHIRQTLETNLSRLPEKYRYLFAPQPYEVQISSRLFSIHSDRPDVFDS